MKKQFMALVLALVLCLGLAVPVSAAGFSDVPADHWASEQINRAVVDGIVGGYADGSFRPSAPVSYAAFSLMLARAFYANELAAYPSGGTEAGEAIMNRHNILSDTQCH
ncbi:MAG: S-layer homology domain-containing protein [Dysosmobacter sp.]|nr:S-layer homology domain-containing protein [Dysosmobacter sp.]